MTHLLIVGAGVFGAAAALHLAEQGYAVTILDPEPIPHGGGGPPLAESTDISKIVRLEYGPDEDYLSLMEQALPVWRQWSARQARPLFHEVGVTFLSRAAFEPGSFEQESYRLLSARGHPLQRLQGEEIARRFPAFAGFVDGYFNPQGGFAESGAVVSWMLAEAIKLGAVPRGGVKVIALLQEGARVVGVRCEDGTKLFADEVILASGAWALDIAPEVAPHFRTVGQPVFHLRPSHPARYTPPGFTVFGGDIANTGFYGFPLSAGGVVKIANHGVGRAMHPSSPARQTTQEEERALRAFLRQHLPALAEDEIVYTRICVYCDTLDEHFWIARDPHREGLTLATGGSGHAFKFAPVLGALIADAVFARERRVLQKFRWRTEPRAARGEEAARHR